MWALLVGVGAALAFPLVAAIVFQRSRHQRNRRACRRRTEKIRLSP
jgi:hypothetical protein